MRGLRLGERRQLFAGEQRHWVDTFEVYILHMYSFFLNLEMNFTREGVESIVNGSD
jgi:hypothetical protein